MSTVSSLRAFIELFSVLFIGLAIGGFLSWLSIQNNQGFGALTIGQWTAWPLAGSINADPYSKAKVAADGDVPLGAAEGLALHARTDIEGQKLRRECQYRLAGQTPPARLWTLSAHETKGQVLFDAVGQPSHVLSRTLVRGEGGNFEITVGPQLSSGNWLETNGDGPYALILRLYDTPITSTGRITEVDMPTIALTGCQR